MKNHEIKQFRINVSRGDIDDGVRVCPSGCALALAISRATGCKCSLGDRSGALELIRKKSADFTLPLAAKRFMAAFDAHREVRPMSFRISVDAQRWQKFRPKRTTKP